MRKNIDFDGKRRRRREAVRGVALFGVFQLACAALFVALCWIPELTEWCAVLFAVLAAACLLPLPGAAAARGVAGWGRKGPMPAIWQAVTPLRAYSAMSRESLNWSGSTAWMRVMPSRAANRARMVHTCSRERVPSGEKVVSPVPPTRLLA